MSQWYATHKQDDTISETETCNDQITGVDGQIPGVDDQITGVDDQHITRMDDKIPDIADIETTEK